MPTNAVPAKTPVHDQVLWQIVFSPVIVGEVRHMRGLREVNGAATSFPA